MKKNEVDRTKLSPMMLQYMDIKDKYIDIIVFFRLGDFYEMFFEDAVLVSKELEITLTGKNAGLDERIPMCGVPHHSSTVYINKLIEKGYKVAICEQIEDPKDAKGVVKRDVVQVISKGTVMNNDSLDEKSNNFLGSVLDFNHCFVVSYCDISTGIFNTIILENNKNLLIMELISLSIKEIVIKNDFDRNILDILKEKHNINYSFFDNTKEFVEYKELYSHINDLRYIESIKHLLTYLNETQKRSLSHLQKVNIVNSKAFLKMDVHTKRNLELVESLRLKSRNYSLLWLLDKTKTAMGSRLLKTYIENPLINIEEINKRYQIVEKLLEEFILKEELKALLYEVYDLERLCGRISYGNANARDLLQLKKSIKILPNFNNILKDLAYFNSIDTLEDLYQILDSSINEDPPITLKEGFLIKDGYNAELDELKLLKRDGKKFLLKFETEEKEKTGIKNLKVGYNKIFGYYIEIPKGSINQVKNEFGYERKQTLANCERYITPLLKEKEDLILNAEDKIIKLEYKLFLEIREVVKNYISKIQKTAKVISEIDVLQSFATVSEENNYIKPKLIKDRQIKIIDGRHPVVEKVIKDEFVPNDIFMDNNTDILLITGPNMSGKSTYMRELVIIVIMAQIGCFVPCKEAEIPIFDKIFTRIGASDDLVSGESTFMVEMIEANNAISNASKNSLIIFDELGRGTATYDGMALAQSIIEYIHNNIKCKTLFSTHYHELTDLEKDFKNLKNIHVSALEEDGKITFLHKVKNGSIDKSYGLHVAKLANLPEKVITRANEILGFYENKTQPKKIIQESFEFEKQNNKLIEEIKQIDILNVNPIEALNILNSLIEKAKKE